MAHELTCSTSNVEAKEIILSSLYQIEKLTNIVNDVTIDIKGLLCYYNDMVFFYI